MIQCCYEFHASLQDLDVILLGNNLGVFYLNIDLTCLQYLRASLWEF
jgi:hypothetical protein